MWEEVLPEMFLVQLFETLLALTYAVCCLLPEANYMEGLNGNTYASQNLYVQPPTRQSMLEDKSNLVPRGRSRGPLMGLDGGLSLSQLDRPASPSHSRSRSGLEEPPDPPRPPPPRPEGRHFENHTPPINIKNTKYFKYNFKGCVVYSFLTFKRFSCKR